MTERVAWLGETLSNQAEDEAVAAYKRERARRSFELLGAIERERRIERRVEIVALVLMVVPVLLGLVALLRWLG